MLFIVTNSLGFDHRESIRRHWMEFSIYFCVKKFCIEIIIAAVELISNYILYSLCIAD